MRLILLHEDEKGASEINEVASLIEKSPAVVDQFPDLPKQLRDLSKQIIWQPTLTPERRQQLSKRLGMRLGGNFTDRSSILEKMQRGAKYDHGALMERMEKMKGDLEKAFPESIITARVKSPKSLAKKLKSDRYREKSLANVKDLIGARVISPMTKMLPESVVLVENKIDVYRKRNFFRANDERPLNPSVVGENYYGVNYLTNADGYSAEVQVTVRPLEVWNDLQHVLLYKPAVSITPDIAEKLAHIRDNVLWHVFMGEQCN